MSSKLKRFLSLLLAFTMVLSIVPVSAESSDGAVVETGTSGDSVVVTDPVAKIGNDPYYKLTDAFEAAQHGDTITLQRDVKEVVRLSVADGDSVPGVVLDLNGKTWDCGYGTRINAVDLRIENGTIGTNRRSAGFDGNVDVFYFGGHATLPSKMELTGVTFYAELRVNNMAPSDEELELLATVRSTGKAFNATEVTIQNGQYDVVTVQKAAYLTINGGWFSGIHAEEGAIVEDNRGNGESSDDSETTDESTDVTKVKIVHVKTLEQHDYARTERGVTLTFVDCTPIAERDYMQFTVGASSTTFTVQRLEGEKWVNVEAESGTSTIKHTFAEPATATFRLDWDNNGTFDRLIVLVKAAAKVENQGSAILEQAVTGDSATLDNEGNGAQGFATLEKAIVAAQPGDTITLLADIELSESLTVAAEKSISINLSGYTLSQSKACTASYAMIENRGTLTIVGPGKISFTDTGAGDPSFGWGSYTINNRGTLVVNDATIEHLGAQAFATHMICAIQQSAGSTTINSGTISTPNYRSVRVNKGSLTINGGTLDGQVWLQPNQGDVTLIVTGGDFSPNGKDGSSIFMTNVGENYTVTSASIEGGTFATKIGCSDATNLAGSISGGSFSESAKTNTDEALLAEGYIFGKPDADGFYTAHEAHYVVQVGDVQYETLAEALEAAKGEANIVVELLADATLDITAWQELAIGGEGTSTITINGNDKTLTFNKLNSDWSHVATNGAKLILNNMTITDSGYNNGPWNRYDIVFACPVELNGVASTKALAFKAGATLNNVTINESKDVYAIWIQPNGQNVTINGLTVTSAGRGIKVDNEYVDNARAVNLSVTDATFTTAKKAAILVKSPAATNVTLSNVNIAGVAADSTNAVWNDADNGANYSLITVTGGTLAQEDVPAFAAVITAGDNVKGYYETLDEAFAAAQAGDTVTLLADASVATIDVTDVTIDLNDCTLTLTAGGSNFYGASTVKNGTINITGCTAAGDCIIGVGDYSNSATLNLDNVNITGNGYSSAYAVLYVYNSSTLNINGGSIVVSNDSASGGGVIKAEDGADGKINITGTESDPVELTFNNAKIGILDGTVVMNYVDLDITGGANAINQSALTVKNSTLTIKNCDGRALTLNDGDVTIENSTLDFSGATEGEIRFKKALTLNIVGDTDIVECDIWTDVAGAKVVGADSKEFVVTGTENAPESIAAVDGMLILPPTGSITPGYTREGAVWGEGGGNAEESLVIELYVDETKIASASLNNVDGIIDGDVYVTWSIPFAGSTDGYWNVEWVEGYPNKEAQPTKVVLYVDDVEVATNDVQMNGPDNLNPVVWAELDFFKPFIAQTMDASGNVVSSFKDFESAVAAATTDGSVTRIEVLEDYTQNTIATPGETYTVLAGQSLTIGSTEGENNTVSLSRANGEAFSIYMYENGASLTIESNVTLEGIDIVANGFATSGNDTVINGNLKAMSLKQWSSNGDITVNGTVNLGYGDGQLDLAYGNGSLTVNGSLSGTADLSGVTPQVKAGYSGTRGDGNTINLKNTYYEAGAWFSMAGSNGTINVDGSVMKVSGGDASGKLTVSKTGNNIVLTNGGRLAVGTITLGADNKITLDKTSAVEATTITGAGAIVVDATDMAAGDVVNVTGDLSGFTGTYEVINNNKLEAVLSDDGQIVLVEKKLIEVTYADGTVEYFSEMLDAVPYTTNYPKLEGATVKLLDDIEAPGIRMMENGMVLDLNGFTYTITAGTGSQGTNTSGFQIRSEVTEVATIKNGTIKVAEGAPVVWMFNNYATNFVVEDVTVDCTNMAWSYGESCYVHVSRPGDNTQFTGTTQILNFNAEAAGAAINVGGTMTAADTVELGGTVELDNGATLTAREGLDVVASDSNYVVSYSNGVYSVIAKVASVTDTEGNVTYYGTLDGAFVAAADDDEVKILKAGTYALSASGKNITITGAVEGVVFDNIGAKNMGGANVTFNNVTFDYYPNENYTGLQHSGNLEYNDCIFNGQVFLYGNSEIFNNCIFNQNSSGAYNVWTYAANATTFNNCTFNSAGKSVLVYNEGDGVANLTVNNSKFYASEAVDGKAAIEINTQYEAMTGTTIKIKNSTAEGFAVGSVSGETLWNDKSDLTNLEVWVDDDFVWPVPALPTATVTELENENLTFALNFKADEATQAQLNYYGDWYADFVLTLNKDATFNANGGADGYLSGQYDACSENWVNVPFEDAPLKANESLKIMEYAAKLMNQSGLKLTYKDVYDFVKDFDCGVFFTNEYLKSNQDLVVTLELRMYNPEDETESYVIGETYTFKPQALSADMTYSAYGFSATGEGEKYRERFAIDLYNVYARESLVIELYDEAGNLLATTSTRETDRDDGTVFARPIEGSTTVNIVVSGRLAGSWDTEWVIAPSANKIPHTAKIYADALLVDTYYPVFDAQDEADYAALPGVAKVASVTDAEGKVTYYGAIADAIKAAEVGELVAIYAGNYTENVTVNKAITVVGETDEEGNNLVNINGKLSVSGSDVTVKNLNVSNPSGNAGVISGGNILIEGCNLTGSNGLRSCYANDGKVTIKDCVITGGTYGVHFDGGAGEGEVIIDGCTITGWTSFGSAVEGVTITDTDFLDGNYEKLRFYQDATMTGCTFPETMSFDFGKNEVTAKFDGCTAGESASVATVVYLGDIVEMGVKVYVDGELLVVAATVTNAAGEKGYYLTLAEAIEAAQSGETVTILTEGPHKLPGFSKNLTIEAAEGVAAAIDMSGAVNLRGSNVVFNGLTFNYSTNANYIGLQEVASETYNNCVINGQMFAYGNPANFTNCEFNQTSTGAYNIWTYGADNATFTNCDFNSAGKAMLIYNEGDCSPNVTVTGCTFTASESVDGKAAIEIDTSLMKTGKTRITITDTTAIGFAAGSVSGERLWNDKKDLTNLDVYVDGEHVWPIFVAQIGETQYTSLAKALEAAQDGDTILVLKDHELSAPLTVTKTVTIDLGGCEVTYTSDVMGEAMITNKGNLTLTGEGEINYIYTGAADTSYGKGNYTISNGGTLTIAGPSIVNSTAKMSHACYTIDNNSSGHAATLIVDAGEVINQGGYAIRQFVNGNANIVTINGGNVTGTRAVWMQLSGSDTSKAPVAELNVTGGTLTATGENGGYKLAVYSYNYGNSLANTKINITGGTLNGDVALTGGANKTVVETVTVTGGKINDLYSYGADELAVPAIALTGGTFNTNDAEYYALDDGYIFRLNAEGTYDVVEGTYVAQIGDVMYETLDEAFEDAVDDDEVIILAAGTYALNTSGKNITITGAVTGVVFDNIGTKNLGGADVTFNNVTFNYASDSTYKGLQHSGDLTYNNCTFNGQVFLYGTSETFTNCTFNTTDANNYNVWLYSAAEVKFTGCTFNCAGKSVLLYHESPNVANNVTVVECDFIASDPVAGKAAIEIDTSLMTGTVSKVTIDAATTATGFAEGSISGETLWNDKKNKTNIEVWVAGEQVWPIFVATVTDTEGNVEKFVTLEAAVAAAQDGETVTLLDNITLTDVMNIERAITLNLGGKTLTGADGAIVLNIKADTTIKNGTITGNKSGTTSGLIDIYADLTMEGVNVTTSKINALRFKAGECTATLTDCTVTGAFKGYGGSVWNIQSGTYIAASTAINDQLNGSAAISGGTFHYEIEETECAPGYTVVDNGDGTWTVKYAPACFVDANNNGVLDEGEAIYASLEPVFANHTEGDVYVVLTADIAAKNQVDTDVDAHYYFSTNVAGGAKMDFLFADNWNYVQKMTVGENITLTAPYLLAWTELNINGKVDTGYAYFMGADVTVEEGAELNVTTGEATVQVKSDANLTVNGTVNASTINVWGGEAKMTVSGANAKVDASWIDIWDGTPSVVVENGATLTADNMKASRGGTITVDAATLDVVVELGHNGESKGEMTILNDGTIAGANLTTLDSTVTGPEGLTTITTDIADHKVVYEEGVYKVAPKTYVAETLGVKYETLAEALEAAEGESNIVVTLLADATLDITSWDTLAIGGDATSTITINGNGNTLTFNKLDSDWSHVATKNGAKLILNNMTINDSGYNNGPWNRYDINFACPVELNNVTSQKALAFKSGATLNDVTVNESGDNYAIWIQANGQTVSIDGLDVNSAGRGIKIDEQYVGAEKVNLTVKNADFDTAKKAAIMVKSSVGANVTVENVDITGVTADTTNVVWNDEDAAVHYGKVKVEGGTKIQEGDFAAAIIKDAEVWAYYKTLPEAVEAVQAGESIELVADVELTEAYALPKSVTLETKGKTLSGELQLNDAELTLTSSDAVLNVTTNVADCKVVYKDGMYMVVEKVYVAQIGEVKYETLDEAFTAAVDGDEVEILVAGTYALSTTGKNITITGTVEGVVFDNIGTKNMGGADVTFNNVTFNYASNSTYKGLQHSGDLVYNNCTFNGQVFLYGASETFNNCTFNTTDANNYNVWTYSAAEVQFTNCTFNSAGKSVLVYNEGACANHVTVTDSEFVASSSVDGKAAIEIDTTKMPAGTKVEITNTTDNGFAAGSISGKTLWNDKKNQTNLEVWVDGVQVWPIFVAQIGETKYTTLQAAVDAAVNGDTIVLLKDIAEDVVVEQKPDVKITIDGIGKTLDGTITVNGKSAGYDTAGLTIQNVNFSADTISKDAFINLGGNNNIRYTRNVTISNCTFTAAPRSEAIVAIKQYTGGCKNLTVDNCTATGVHSLIQLKNVEVGLSITDCTITESKNGISMGNSINATISGCTMDVDGYGIRADGNIANKLTVSGCTIDAEMPIVVRKTTAAYELAISGANALTAGNEEGYQIIFTNDDDGTYVEPTGAFVYTADEANADLKVFPTYVAEIEGKGYMTLAAAVEAAEAGDTVTLLKDIDEAVELNKSIALDVNDTNYTGTITLTDAAATLTAAEGLNVTTNLDDHAVVYEVGVYKVVKVLIEFRNISTDAAAEVLLNLKFYIPEEVLADENGYAILKEEPNEVIEEGSERKFTMAQIKAWGTDSKGRYTFSQPISSGEMTGDVSVEFYDSNGNVLYIRDGDGSAKTMVSRTVVDYNRTALALGSAKQKKLSAAMVTFGGYAQQYYGVDVENLAYDLVGVSPDLSGITADLVGEATSLSGADIGLTCTGTSAVLDSRMGINVSFKLADGASIDDYEFILTYTKDGVDGQTKPLTASENGAKYQVKIADVPVAYWDYMYTITATNKTTGESYVVKTSVLSFAKSCIKYSSDQKLVNMAKAMYLYNQAANEFFGK